MARMLQPALLVHFALVFPRASPGTVAEIAGHLSAFRRRCSWSTSPWPPRTSTFCRRSPAGKRLDQIEFAYLGALLPAGRGNFPGELFARAERRFCGSN